MPLPIDTRDLRERAREWIRGFHEATEQDRVNCVALLLGAADDALQCAMDGHKTRGTLLALGWTPPGDAEVIVDQGVIEVDPAPLITYNKARPVVVAVGGVERKHPTP